MAMQLGASLPIGDFGAGPAIVRDYAQAAEGLGYDFLCAPDHVLGVDPAKISAGGPRMGSNATAYHDPFVLFGYLSGLTKKIEFVAGVLILAQRQAALVAKQAAELSILSDGRLNLGVAISWNPYEYQAMGQDIHTRGRRLEEQMTLLRRFWTEPFVDFQGEFHTVEAVGLNRLPARPIPLWIGTGTDEIGRAHV